MLAQKIFRCSFTTRSVLAMADGKRICTSSSLSIMCTMSL